MMNKELIKTSWDIHLLLSKYKFEELIEQEWYPLTEHEKELFLELSLRVLNENHIKKLEKEIGELHKEHKHFKDDCKVCKAVIDVECDFRTNKLKDDILKLKEHNNRLQKYVDELETEQVQVNKKLEKENQDLKNLLQRSCG